MTPHSDIELDELLQPPEAEPAAAFHGLLAGFLEMAEGSEARPLTTIAALRQRYADDFLGFCHLLEIVPKATGAGPQPFIPNEVQLSFCKARTGRDVVLKARQLGFTTIELARDVWFFLTRPGAVVKVLCQSISDHAALNTNTKRIQIMFEALRKRGLALEFAAEATGRWLLSPADGAAALDVVEAGASEAAAQKKGRTDTVHRLHVTEVAFFEYAALTLNALLECVPKRESGSEVTFESTPNGMGSDDGEADANASGGPYFYAQCQRAAKGGSGYKLHFFSWMDMADYRLPLDEGETIVPETERERQAAAMGASPEQLKWYRRKLADEKNGNQDLMDQEYPSDPKTCFLVDGRQFFDKTRTEQLLERARGIKPISEQPINRLGAVGVLRIWHMPQPGRRYVVSGDASEGTGGDRGAAQVWEEGTGKHYATLAGQFKPAELAREMERLGYAYNIATLAPERNNHGHALIAELEREDPPTVPTASRKRRYPRIFKDYDDKLGWITHAASRGPALSALEQVHREGKWESPDEELIGEMRTFVVTKRGKAEAAKGARDDLVITAAIAWDVLGRVGTQGGAPRQSGVGW